jgi:malate synthase
MALVESHPIAYQMEEFLYHLREHILGLNLGRWDYMASLIHFTLEDPAWVLPDRNTIPHDVPFFQRVRLLMADICHRRGALAIGGMTALYPSREDPELNARALAVLEQDKRNEAHCFMDGAWTGHPTRTRSRSRSSRCRTRSARSRPAAIATRTCGRCPRASGAALPTAPRRAVRTVIRYRNGVLNGKGASLLDGYMEDLATDRIYRLMLAHRMKHSRVTPITDAGGKRVEHTPEYIHQCFESALEKLIAELPRGKDWATRARCAPRPRRARR